MNTRTLTIKDYGKDYGLGRFAISEGHATLFTSNTVTEIIERIAEELFAGDFDSHINYAEAK